MNTREEYEEFLENMKIPNLRESPLMHTVELFKKSNKSGMVLEFGVYSGKTINQISKKLDDKKVYGFDSFEGLPESWNRPDKKFGKGFFNVNGKLPRVNENVTLVKGWYNETLPKFCEENNGRKVSFLHIDCDIYSSTKCVFENLSKYNMLDEEVYIVFDELVNYPTYERHEIKAFYEFIKENEEYSYEIIGMNGEYERNSMRESRSESQSVGIKIKKKRR